LLILYKSNAYHEIGYEKEDNNEKNNEKNNNGLVFLNYFLINEIYLYYYYILMIVAHRGYSGLDNTLEGFYISWSNGIEICECDVRLTKDGILVANHDRICNDNIIKNTNYVDLNCPRLLDILQMAKNMNSKLIIEMKTNRKEIGTKLAIFLKDNSTFVSSIELVMSFSKGCLYSFYDTYLDNTIKLFLLSYNIPKKTPSDKITGYYVKYNDEIFVNDDFKLLIKVIPIGIWGSYLFTCDNSHIISKLQNIGVKYINTNKPLFEKISDLIKDSI